MNSRDHQKKLTLSVDIFISIIIPGIHIKQVFSFNCVRINKVPLYFTSSAIVNMSSGQALLFFLFSGSV